MPLIFSDTTARTLVGSKFSLSPKADHSLQFMLRVFRYRIVGTKGELVNGLFGDRFDTGDTTRTSLEYVVPQGERHLFKLSGDIIGTAPAPGWSGKVAIDVIQTTPRAQLTTLGGAQAVTGSDFVPVEVRGGFIVQG